MKCAIRTFATAFAALAVFAAVAVEPWEPLEDGWYTPVQEHQPQSYTLKYGDATGVTTDIEYVYDETVGGNVAVNSNEVLGSIKQTLYSVAQNVISIAASITDNMNDIQTLKERFSALATNLDETFSKVFSNLRTLEEKDADGKTVKTLTDPVVRTVEKKVVYRVSGGGVATDERSVEFKKISDGTDVSSASRRKTKAPKLQMFNFDAADDGQIPFKHNASLWWRGIDKFADGTTLAGWSGGKDGEQDWPYIGLKGWDAPEQGDALCAPKLGEMLSGAKAANEGIHYVLTRCKDGKQGGKLHYTKIGNFAGGADNAGKYLRTSSDGESSEWAFPVTAVKSGGGIDVETDEKTGAVTLTLDGEAISVQSEATTDGTTALMSGRRVVFKAMDDSCVKVNVAHGASTNEIVVSIGCYYK